MVIEGVELRVAPPTDPDVLALTTAQQAELAAMYGEDQPLVALHPDITFTLLYDSARDVRTFASRREEASVQVSQQFTKAVTGLFRFAYRRVTVETGSPAVPVTPGR